MLQPILDSLLSLLARMFSAEVGTTDFYLLLGCAFAGMLVMARLLSGAFGSSKGIVVTSIAVCIPLLLAALGYALVEVYALPEIDADWATQYLPWVTFTVVLLFAGAVIAAKILEIGRFSAIIVLVLAGTTGVCLEAGGRFVMTLLDAGEVQVDKKKKSIEEAMEE